MNFCAFLYTAHIQLDIAELRVVLSKSCLEKTIPCNAVPMTEALQRTLWVLSGFGPVQGGFDLLDGSVCKQELSGTWPLHVLGRWGRLLPSAVVVLSSQRHDSSLGLTVP